MEDFDHLTLLPKLGTAIDNSLHSWESYLVALARFPTYTSLISNDVKDTTTKVKALEHILETLPTRHQALVHSYNDPDLDFSELPELCANLVEDLQSSEWEIELDEWFNKMLISKRFTKNVAALEKDIRNEEQWRSQELKRLKASHKCLMVVREDGELGTAEVRALVEAMEELGIPLFKIETLQQAVDEARDQGGDSSYQIE